MGKYNEQQYLNGFEASDPLFDMVYDRPGRTFASLPISNDARGDEIISDKNPWKKVQMSGLPPMQPADLSTNMAKEYIIALGERLVLSIDAYYAVFQVWDITESGRKLYEPDRYLKDQEYHDISYSAAGYHLARAIAVFATNRLQCEINFCGALAINMVRFPDLFGRKLRELCPEYFLRADRIADFCKKLRLKRTDASIPAWEFICRFVQEFDNEQVRHRIRIVK